MPATADPGGWSGGGPDGERALRSLVRQGPGLTVLTGGQTGVDTDSALTALRAGLRVHLVFPRAFRQEDGTLTPARRRRLRGAVLHDLPSASFRYRTWTCVYLSDVVVLLDPAGGSGCLETARAARRLGRPLLRPAPGQLTAAQAASWLAENGAEVLMVAGCRASVLAGSGTESGLRTDLTALMAAARERHDQLLTPPSQSAR